MSLKISWGCLIGEIPINKSHLGVKYYQKASVNFSALLSLLRFFSPALFQGKSGNPGGYVLVGLHSHCVLETSPLNDCCTMPGSRVQRRRISWARFCHCTQKSRLVHLAVYLCSPGTHFSFLSLFSKGQRQRSRSSTAPPYQLVPPTLVTSSGCFQQSCLFSALPCEHFFPAAVSLPLFSVYSHALFALLLWTRKQHLSKG